MAASAQGHPAREAFLNRGITRYAPFFGGLAVGLPEWHALAGEIQGAVGGEGTLGRVVYRLQVVVHQLHIAAQVQHRALQHALREPLRLFV